MARLQEYSFVLDHDADVVVRFWVEGHHMHRYSSTGEKEDPTIFHHGTAQEAMRAAIDIIRSEYKAMISSWR